jgi:hypothetical protein
MSSAIDKAMHSAEYIRDSSRSTSPELISKYAEDIIDALERLKDDVQKFNEFQTKSAELVKEVQDFCREREDVERNNEFEGMMTKANAIYRHLLVMIR